MYKMNATSAIIFLYCPGIFYVLNNTNSCIIKFANKELFEIEYCLFFSRKMVHIKLQYIKEGKKRGVLTSVRLQHSLS